MSGSFIGNMFRDPDSLARLRGLTEDVRAKLTQFKEVITERREGIGASQTERPSQSSKAPNLPTAQLPASAPGYQTPQTLKTRECTICLETLPIERFPRVTKSCFHEPDAREYCLGDWIEATLNGLNWNKLNCVDKSCRFTLQFTDIQRLASPKMLER